MWNVSTFMDKSIFPADGKNPFTYSMNLGGSAAHGDYVFGWKDNTLQLAMDNGCNLDKDCAKAKITKQQPDVYNACTKKQQAPEEVDGCECPLLFPVPLCERYANRHPQGSSRCRWARWPARHKGGAGLGHLN